jgi:hypothetical protein
VPVAPGLTGPPERDSAPGLELVPAVPAAARIARTVVWIAVMIPRAAHLAVAPAMLGLGFPLPFGMGVLLDLVAGALMASSLDLGCSAVTTHAAWPNVVATAAAVQLALVVVAVVAALLVPAELVVAEQPVPVAVAGLAGLVVPVAGPVAGPVVPAGPVAAAAVAALLVPVELVVVAEQPVPVAVAVLGLVAVAGPVPAVADELEQPVAAAVVGASAVGGLVAVSCVGGAQEPSEDLPTSSPAFEELQTWPD